MDLAVVHSRAVTGIQSPPVTAEVHLSGGLPRISIVGLPETAVRESADRVRGAVLSNWFRFPRCRITVSLAPADLPKEGGRFDLAVAVALLAASGQLADDQLESCELIGELALTGRLRPVRGVLPSARAVKAAGRSLILPVENAAEASLVRELDIRPAGNLLEVCRHLDGTSPLPCYRGAVVAAAPRPQPDLDEVRGQHHARRALEIAAAGRHNLLMFGPPGTGKTMLAERLPGILPPLTEPQALETAALLSISRQGFDMGAWGRRPFRAPHHTASPVALVGGGSHPRPGEISLAHNGVLFLDELPEFDRRVLEALREPLESGRVVISRAAHQAEFPADFQLLAAMNPCPCGYLGDPSNRCRCTEEQVSRYHARLSGPLLDRFDMHVEVPQVPPEVLLRPVAAAAESSHTVQARVAAAQARQLERAGRTNGRLGNRDVERCCRLSPSQTDLMQRAMERLGLSARAMHRVLKVALTIADLAADAKIRDEYLAEALSYRRLGRRVPAGTGLHGGSAVRRAGS